MENLEPFFVPKPWGGNFIADHFGLPPGKIGEAMILSTLTDQETTIENKSLSSFLGHSLPYLIKIIDAAEPLSIQVHPDDNWAKELENSTGKSECWLVLKAEPGAGVYLGLRPQFSEQDFREALLKHSDVEPMMEFCPVIPGDFISVPAGAIHAIGGGITILEVQQCSGITYRLWDWGRKDRELHIDKGLLVSNFKLRPRIQTNIFKDDSSRSLLIHKDFQVSLNEGGARGWAINLKTLEVHQNPANPVKNYLFVK